MARVKKSIIAKRRLLMLDLIHARGGESGGCVMAIKDLALVLGLSPMQTRGLMKVARRGARSALWSQDTA